MQSHISLLILKIEFFGNTSKLDNPLHFAYKGWNSTAINLGQIPSNALPYTADKLHSWPLIQAMVAEDTSRANLS
jgi:hypothetical protein